MTDIEDILHQVASEKNVSLTHVREILRSQFILVRDTIQEAKKDEDGLYIRRTFKNIKLPYFGKFVVKDGRVNFLNRIKKQANERLRTSTGSHE